MESAYLAVVAAVVLTPGLDSVLVLRSTVAAGRHAGVATTVGIGSASALHALLTSVGIGAVILRVQPLFQIMKWAGVAYLLWLAAQSLRTAWRGAYQDEPETGGRGVLRDFRQGFLCNITNPKMFVFYLALLPQFVAPSAAVGVWLAHALAVPVLGTAWLIVITLGVAWLRGVLLRRVVRRALDALSGFVLLGFGAKLARDA